MECLWLAALAQRAPTAGCGELQGAGTVTTGPVTAWCPHSCACPLQTWICATKPNSVPPTIGVWWVSREGWTLRGSVQAHEPLLAVQVSCKPWGSLPGTGSSHHHGSLVADGPAEGPQGSASLGSPCRGHPVLAVDAVPDPREEGQSGEQASALQHFNCQQPADAATSVGCFKDNKSGPFQTGALPRWGEGMRTTGATATPCPGWLGSWWWWDEGRNILDLSPMRICVQLGAGIL